ncbi:MAG: type VI secretion system baseplate subunit TssK [Gammaproteobacteria bacterium]|nr:type VI secretion system baseplate subunit TssK [Gammaproteobacteria bacterium]
MQISLKKVVWAEGVLLGQQHFQKWEEYLKAERQVFNRSITPFAWGLCSLKIDMDALLNNQFRLKHCLAILENGLLLNYDVTESDVLSCELSAANNGRQTIYLGVGLNQYVGGITGYKQGDANSAWIADYQTAQDLYDREREREVLFAKLNLKLLQESDDREKFQSIPIAEVMSMGEKGFQLLDDFVPPTLHIKTSTMLQTMLTRMLEIISAKIRVLNAHRYEQDDPVQLLLLTILNGAFKQLQHLAKQPDSHPEKLFQALTDLICRLGAFSEDFLPYDLPDYQHDKLTATFTPLNNIAQKMLEAVMPTRMATLQLRRENDSLYLIDSIDSALLSQADFFIAVYFPAENPDWVAQFARQIKVASHNAIESLITSALTGVRVVHTQRPPSKLSVKTGYEYFYLEQRGDFWEQIIHDRSLGIFLPHAFIKANIEMVTVQK